MDETERAELIAALHQSATFGESMLDLNERLLDTLASDSVHCRGPRVPAGRAGTMAGADGH